MYSAAPDARRRPPRTASACPATATFQTNGRCCTEDDVDDDVRHVPPPPAKDPFFRGEKSDRNEDDDFDLYLMIATTGLF
jgi:hypothetical protein